MKKFLLSLLGAAACLTASATDYELVTSAGELIPGDNYIVVGKKAANTYGMGALSSTGNNYSAVEVTLSGTKITLSGTEGVLPVILQSPWNSGIDDPCKNNRNHGCGGSRRERSRQWGYRARDVSGMGDHVSLLRSDRLSGGGGVSWYDLIFLCS